MKTINRVQLMGCLGRDPKVSKLPSGQVVANFEVATTDTYVDKEGNSKERTEWTNIVAYGRCAEIVEMYLKKGSRVMVEGRLRTRDYISKTTQQKMHITEVIMENVFFLDLTSGK